MGLGDAVNTCFSKYATFSGRATRSEYWYWVLFTVLVAIGLAIVEVVITNLGGQILSAIFDLATIIPSIAVASRRLHDIDRSGWWQLLFFIPVIGWLVLLYWFVQSGTPTNNRFG
jgi:uncharacterized membrane protein YhaH (DUF805 family)